MRAPPAHPLLLASVGLIFTCLSGCSDQGVKSGCNTNADCPGGWECRGSTCAPADNPQGDERQGDADRGDTYHAPGDDNRPTPPGDDDWSGVYTGPKVTIISPRPFQLVSGEYFFEASIAVPSGQSVVAVTARIASLDGVSMAFSAQTGEDTYSYALLFDTTTLPSGLLYPTLSITAVDGEGNRGSNGITFAIDNMAPLVSLNPPKVQFARFEDPVYVCSEAFYPTGENSLWHGDVISPSYTWGPFFYPRARIQDRGNSDNITTGVGVYLAGIDDAAVLLYIVPTASDSTTPTVIGPTGGPCRINPLVKPDPADPASTSTVVQRLKPVLPKGAPNFSGLFDVDPGFPKLPPPAPPDTDQCIGVDLGVLEPELLCTWPPSTWDVPIWISYTGDDLAAIYGIEPSTTEPILCGGGPFDAYNLPDGPACVAIEATDLLGNYGVSPSIAICVDADGIGDECVDFDPALIPCATCTPPDYTQSSVRIWEQG